MWASVATVPAGKPANVAVTSTVADVIAPALSLTVFMVTVAWPLAPDSAFVIGGTSLLAASVAANTNLFTGPVGVVGVLSLLQPAAHSVAARASIEKRDIVVSPCPPEGGVQVRVERTLRAVKRTFA